MPQANRQHAFMFMQFQQLCSMNTYRAGLLYYHIILSDKRDGHDSISIRLSGSDPL